jgi:hypothetical protein
MHDPALWFAEAACWVLDDSGLTDVLDADSADELLGRPLFDALTALRSGVDTVGRSDDVSPAPSAEERDELAKLARVALSNLDGVSSNIACVRGPRLR